MRCLCAGLIFAHAMPVYANPVDGVVSAGQATIGGSGTTVHIDQQSDRAVIDWRGFDIAPGERTEFQQPSTSSIALNRVNSGAASHIDGQLSANGNLVIVNQNGVLFGRGAQVDVNSIVATTADISNDQFMAGGKLVFDKPGNPDAQIVNEGTITAKEAGLVGFVAPRVENHGVITARMGRAHLASGDTATVDFYGDGLLEVAVSDSVSKQLVENTGTINADGGLVAMTAAAGRNIVDSVINAQGTIQARTLTNTNTHTNQSGKILIAGNKATDVIIDGLIDASGLGTQQTGGAVHILGNRIALMNNSTVTAAGDAGAGEILVGGDYHGGTYRGTLDAPATAVEWGNTPGGYSAINGSPTAAFFAAYYQSMSRNGGVPTASRVFVDNNVTLDASSANGNAGRIITWSNDGTAFYGHAIVTAGGITGNGGFVEISGKDWLSFAGNVDSRSVYGANGMLLLDPADITISVAADSVITGSSPFQSTGGSTSNLNVTTLQNALAAGSVTITSAAGAGGTGNITFTDAVAWNSANSLTVTASNNIAINNTIANSGTGNITLNANVAAAGSITIAADVSTGGSITAAANRDITLNATKTLTTGAAGSLNLQAAGGSTAGTGNLTLNGNLSVGTGGMTLLSGVNGTRPSYTLSATNFTQQGASLGATSITGFNDLILSRALTINGALTLNTARDLTLSAALSGNNTMSITPGRDFIVSATGSLTSTNAGYVIAVTAARDLTISAGGSIASTATGGLNLQAAGGSTGGTGNLTLSGSLSTGTGALTLLSGVNGTRPSITISTGTLTLLGANVGATSLTGFNDLTLSRALTVNGTLTLNTVRDLTLSAALSTNNTMAITAGRDFIVSGTGSLTSTNAGYVVAVTATRDLTISAGGSIVSTATGGLNLQAAGGSTAGTGNLNLSGSISVGTGALTLLSGINGTRPNLVLSSSTFTLLGATVGALALNGFQDITFSTNIATSAALTIAATDATRDFFLSGTAVVTSTAAISINPGRDFITSGTGSITAGTNFSSLAQRDITIGAGTTVASSATGSMTLQAANNSIAGTGNLTISGLVSVGTGTLTLVSGINVTRPSLTLNTSTLSLLGATVGVVSITGLLDVTVARNITSSGSITISPQQSFTINNSATLATNSASTITILAQKDITVSAGATISAGATGSLVLQAANNSIAGTGNLTISGNIAVGTGALTLLSGINGTRPSLTLNNTTYTENGASVGAVTIDGFLDVTVAKNMTSSGSVTINPQQDFFLTSSKTITVGGAGVFTVLALRDININASTNITTGATGGISLRAANAAIAGTGNLNLSGKLTIGTGALTLLSGINGTRPSLTLNSGVLALLGATVGAVSITGLQDVTLAMNLPSSSTITISPQQDFIINTSQTLSTNSASAITILAQRDITVNAGSTISAGTTGSISLQAANAAIAGTGNLTITGNIAVGTGTLTLLSGINGTRPSLTINATTYTQNSATVGTVSITGFQDVTVSKAMTGSGSITINPQQDFILSASQAITVGGAGTFTVLAQRDITINALSSITTGATGAVSLRAANAAVAGTGNLTLSGKINIGTGNLTLVSGINGTRPSLTLNSTTLAQLGATVGTVSITGIQDLTVAMNLTSSGSITLATQRDLTLNALQTITTGAAGALTMTAANNSVAGTGNLTINGNLSVGTGNLTLLSGINVTRPSYTMTTTNFTQQGATLGVVSIQGFLDLTIDRNLTSSGNVTIIAQRDLNLNATRQITSGAANSITMAAANSATGGTGKFNMNGILSVGTGALSLTSGINVTRPDLTLDATNLIMQGATIGNITIQGFNNVSIARALNTSGTLTIQTNTSTAIAANITSTGAMTFSNAITIAEGTSPTISSTNSNITFSSTINGTAGGVAENLTVSAGTGTVTFSGIVGGTTALGNLTVNADNVTISQNLNGTGTLTLAPVTAGRAVNIGTAQADNATTAGFNLSTAEVGRLVNGWGSIVLGSTNAGALTNSTAAWNDPVSFITGNDFNSTVAITSADPVFVQAVRDVLLTQNITTTNTSANAIVLVAGRNFINTASANPLTTGAGGRWLVYSTDPTGTTGEQTMSNAFNRYSCTYGGSCPTLGTGNGLLYSYTPLLDVTISAQTYNYGDAIIPPTGYTLQTSGYLNALDTSQGIVTGSGNFTTSYVQGDNAGTSFTITNNGSTFASNLGYGFNYISPTGLTVGKRNITVQVSDQSITYGNSLNVNAYTLSSGSFYSTDAAGLVFTSNASLSSSGNYNYSATPWTLSASSANFTSGLASNYNITYVAAPVGLTVNQRALAVAATGVNKVYDGLTSGTVTLGDNRVAGDLFTATYGAATYADKNVGTAKTLSVTGINVTGTDIGNYTFNTTASTTANITQRALTISATGIDKVYDGLTTDTVTLGDNRVAGDVLTTSYTAANFADKNVGTAKSVSVTGLGITGTDAGNYSFNTTTTTTANITQRALTISATGTNRTYDGTTTDTVTLGDNRVAGDVLTTSYTAANFADKNVGTAKSVSVTGLGLTGTDSGNYSFNSTTTTTANITQRALTITATGTNRTYDGTTADTVTLGDNRVAGDVLTTSYTAANFADKNVGTAKAVSVTGLGITGTDAGNYSFNTTAATTANITQRALTISATGIDKVYDGLTTDTVTLGDNRVAGDVLTASYTAANFANKNVGTAKSVSVTGLGLTGTDAGNYTFNTTASTTANITQRALTITATGTNRTYDGTTTDTVTLGDNRVAGDVLTTSYTAANFADKNVGTAKAVSVTGLGLAGTDSGNYSFNTTAATTANITQRALTITASGIDKVYDGLTTDTVTLGDNRVAGDVLTASYTAANFADKNVGTAKAVSVTGLGLTGTDAGNYSFNTTAATTANITQRALTITATGIDKAYNGTTADTVTLGDNRVAGDVLTTSYTAANFADKNVGTAKTVSVTGLGITGTDSGNYSFNTTASTNANITQRALTISATGVDKVYDGTTTDTVTLGDNRVAGDVLTTSYTAANFADKNVGTAKSVSVTGLGITGTDSGNYSFNTTASTNANITQRALTITASGTNKVYDGLTGDVVTLGDNRVAGDVLTTSYTAANFADKNVGTAKSVSVTGLGITGTDAGNYSFNVSATTSADITPRALAITALGTNRTYNGLTTDTVTLGDNRVAGDVLTTSYTAANFADKNVGTAKSVSVTGLGITGTDAGNYTFNTSTTTSADITQRALTITASGTDKVYDGLTADTVTLGDNRVAGDVLTTSYTAANFADKNVGTAKTVSVTGLGLTGTDAGNYTYNTTASTNANITQRALTITASGTNKTYDGLTTDTVTLGDNRVAGDVLTASYTAANFADKNVGTGKSVSVTGLGITGTDAGNYSFNSSATTSADISARALTITASGTNKTYDGLTTDTVTLGDNRVAGDVLTTSYTAANFADKNVGTAKAVSVTGLGLTGTDAGNYTYNTTTTASADISARALTIMATGTNKTYDGTTTDTVTLGDNRVAGDVLTASYTAANFADKNVGTGKSVSVTGLGITGTDAGNYTYNTTATASADITQRALLISATGVDKVYNGLVGATVTLGDNRVAGDVLTASYTAANFADKNVGTAKSINVTGLGITGTDAGNYTYNTTATASADITQRALLISATGTNKTYDGLTTDTVTLGDNRVAGDVLTASYTAANFADKNVGTSKSVSVTGLGITGTDAGNYTYNTTATASADITQRALLISATGTNKTYDGLTTDIVTLGDNRVAGDVLTASYTAANFADKNVGTGKSVSVTGLGITGTDAGNYTYNTTTTASADISARVLTITATGTNKTYDGLTTDTVTLGDNRVAGDVLTTSYTAANFADKNAGIGKTVNVTGVNVTGTDASNYTFASTASTTADISQRALTVSATGVNKVYDGTTAASATFTDNRVAGDVLGINYTGNFVDKNAGTGKSISITGISLSGTDGGNYSVASTASTSANITQRALTIGATGVDKVYDGTTNATVTLNDNRVTGDTLTTSYTAANFADSLIGNGKTVSVTGIGLTGLDSANYTFNTSATTSAAILSTAIVPPVTPPVTPPTTPTTSTNTSPVISASSSGSRVDTNGLFIPNTVKKSIQNPSQVSTDHISDFLIYDDEWQKRQYRLPFRGMQR